MSERVKAIPHGRPAFAESQRKSQDAGLPEPHLRWVFIGQALLLIRRAVAGIPLTAGSLLRLGYLCERLAAAEEERS